jgi:predicted nuclease with TOPRIM domain
MNHDEKIFTLLEKQGEVLLQIQTDMSSVKERLTSIDTRIGTLDTRIDTLDTRIDTLDSRIVNLEIGQSRIAAGQAKLVGDVHNIKHSVDDLYNHFKYAFQDILMLDKRTQSLRNAQ